MPTKKRLWLGGTIAVLILLPVVSIGSAFSAVQSMQTAGTVESLEKALGGTESPVDIALPTETPTPSALAPATQSAQLDASSVSTFLSMLEQLPTDDAPSTHTGYKRDYFNAWIDADGDGCNTRAEVLMMESQAAVTTRGSCTVSTGQWTSAYDGVTLTDASGAWSYTPVGDYNGADSFTYRVSDGRGGGPHERFRDARRRSGVRRRAARPAPRCRPAAGAGWRQG